MCACIYVTHIIISQNLKANMLLITENQAYILYMYANSLSGKYPPI